jgi:DDE domain
MGNTETEIRALGTAARLVWSGGTESAYWVLSQRALCSPYLYRGVDSSGATIDFLLSAQRDAAAAERFLAKALGAPGRQSCAPGTELLHLLLQFAHAMD